MIDAEADGKKIRGRAWDRLDFWGLAKLVARASHSRVKVYYADERVFRKSVIGKNVEKEKERERGENMHVLC